MSRPGRLHDDAAATLADWRAPDEEQERLRQHYLAFLADHGDAMLRSCRPAHLTASALVLSADARQVLLTLHAKSGRWFQLGGHPEPGDTTLAGAALREAVEESGLAPAQLELDPVPVLLDDHPVPFCGPGEGVHHLDVMFVALAAAGAVPARSEESLDLRWWPVDGLPDAELDGFVARARSRVGANSQSWNSSGGRTAEASDQPSR